MKLCIVQIPVTLKTGYISSLSILKKLLGLGLDLDQIFFFC